MPDWLPVARDIAVVFLSVIGILFVIGTLIATVLLLGLSSVLERANDFLAKAEAGSGSIASALARRAVQTGGRTLFERLVSRR